MVICAALSIAQPSENIIVCGYRHFDCYETLYTLDEELSLHARKFNLITNGFLATGNRFLNREEAYQEALHCGQLSAVTRNEKEKKNEKTLYSEDLY